MSVESETLLDAIQGELSDIRSSGLFKDERVIESPQGSSITVRGKEVLNFCANNYLGLAGDPEIGEAAKEAIDRYGMGLASVRFICGTQTIHKALEEKISRFLGTEDTILYSSCFDANAGLFETLLSEQDAVVSDALNHASIIDGVRLCKAQRFRYAHNDMSDLRRCLQEAREQKARRVLITTDGVFSMDGDIAKLEEICTLAEEFGALVHVDDSHATGVIGATGRGSIEACGVQERVAIITSTLGKALGGSSGGFTSGSREVVTLLRQRSRPYLFSNTLAPAIVAAAAKAIDLVDERPELLSRLQENMEYFRSRITDLGFTVRGAGHPIVPVMIGDAKKAAAMADALLERQIYVIGFSYPVVPKGEARIRVQLSAAHSREELDRAIDAFAEVGSEMGVR